LENEKALAAKLIAEKSAEKLLTARQKIGQPPATKKRQASAVSTAQNASTGQKRNKVC